MTVRQHITCLLVWVQASSAVFFPQPGEIIPPEANVYAGEILHLNCTANKDIDDQSTLGFDFTPKPNEVENIVIPKEYLQMISARTVSLALPNMTDATMGWYYCKLWDSQGGVTLMASREVRVAYRPEPVTSAISVSYNYQDLLIDFCPRDTMKHSFIWNVTWITWTGTLTGPTLYPDFPLTCRIYMCGPWTSPPPPNINPNICQEMGDMESMFVPMAVYNLTVLTKPADHNFQDQILSSIHVKAIKPAPVDSISITSSSNSDGVLLKWQAPDRLLSNLPELGLNYSVEIVQDSGKTQILTTGPSRDQNLSMTIEGLSLNVPFNISVSCAVHDAAYWSDPSVYVHKVTAKNNTAWIWGVVAAGICILLAAILTLSVVICKQRQKQSPVLIERVYHDEYQKNPSFTSAYDTIYDIPDVYAELDEGKMDCRSSSESGISASSSEDSCGNKSQTSDTDNGDLQGEHQETAGGSESQEENVISSSQLKPPEEEASTKVHVDVQQSDEDQTPHSQDSAISDIDVYSRMGRKIPQKVDVLLSKDSVELEELPTPVPTQQTAPKIMRAIFTPLPKVPINSDETYASPESAADTAPDEEAGDIYDLSDSFSEDSREDSC